MFPLNVKKKIVVHTENQCIIIKYSTIFLCASECDQLFVKMSAIYKIDCKKSVLIIMGKSEAWMS